MPLLSNMRRTGGHTALRVLLIATAVALVACGGGDDDGDPDVAEGPAPEAGAGALSMGGGALGDQSTTTPVAQGLLDAQPGATVAWTAFTIELGDGDAVEGSGDAGFLYVVAGRIEVEWGDQERSLGVEEGVLVNAGVPFDLRARDGPATVWDIRLRAPADEAAPDYAPAATFAWRSDPLQDIPPLPLAVMAIVTVPPGGQTIVHTHPGPEFIVVTAGRIDYQNAFKQAPGVGVGTTESIGPGVQVQKRNPYDEDGVFLSLFLVDAGQPFASAARFDGGDGGGSPEDNLASLDNGARVVAVSSAFGGAALDERWGGDSAIDGDPTTQWSSDGDGDDAWIEIELAEPAAVVRIGFWTRTMGTSAEIRSFQVVSDDGATHGPFALAGPADMSYFDVDFTTQRLRFEAVETSAGNTGAVEIEVYAAE